MHFLFIRLMEIFVLIALTIPVMFLTVYLYAYLLKFFFKKKIDYKDLIAKQGFRIGFIILIVATILLIYFF